MLPSQPDESSSIRRACSLSDLSMGKGNAKKPKITIHTFFCSNIIREYLRKRQRTYIYFWLFCFYIVEIHINLRILCGGERALCCSDHLLSF